MPTTGEADLHAFLTSLPAYQRKILEGDFLLTSLSRVERSQALEEGFPSSPKFERIWQEYLQLLEHTPDRLRELRKRMTRGRGSKTIFAENIASLLPPGKRGRREDIKRAEQIWQLAASGKKSREIQDALEASGESTSLEAIKYYRKTRRQRGR